ncbi:hypothetical protein FHR76_003213 [Rhizobium sp. RAS22]|nr:hypothetical protein [Rhizobium sp. RAS22]
MWHIALQSQNYRSDAKPTRSGVIGSTFFPLANGSEKAIRRP